VSTPKCGVKHRQPQEERHSFMHRKAGKPSEDVIMRKNERQISKFMNICIFPNPTPPPHPKKRKNI
jgi:hypothetical protein